VGRRESLFLFLRLCMAWVRRISYEGVFSSSGVVQGSLYRRSCSRLVDESDESYLGVIIHTGLELRQSKYTYTV